MQEILIQDPPFMIGEKSIARIEVNEIGFETFIGAVDRVSGKDDYGKLIYRERTKVQCKFFDAAGQPVAIDDTALMQMPLQYGKQLYKALDHESAKPGKVITKGDGITSPIVYELGTPISIKGKGEIRELEFMAKTLGDVEDVLHRRTSYDQTLALLRIAQPLGAEANMLALPGWAVSAITVPDGVTISQEVLPSFLE